MSRQTKALAKVFPILVAALAVGCGQTPANISVNPSEATLSSVGDSVALTAVVLDSKGEEIAQPKLAWSSSDATIATVDETGKVAAVKSGEAIITATAGNVKKDVTVKVAIYSELKLSETAVTLGINETKVVGVQLADENKQPVQGGFVEWKSDNEGVAKVAADGTVTGVASGVANITASTKTLNAQVVVTVAPPAPAALKAAQETVEVKAGESAKVEVQALDAQNNPMQGVALTWTSSDAEKATVGPDRAHRGRLWRANRRCLRNWRSYRDRFREPVWNGRTDRGRFRQLMWS